MRKTFAVAVKETRQIRRDMRTLLILLFVPLYFLLLYGYALNFDVKHVGLAVEDRDQTRESREIVAAFINSGYFDLVATPTSPEETERLIDRDEARAALVIPEDAAERIRAGEVARIQVIISGDNANTASVVMGYATSIVSSASLKLLAEASVRQEPPRLTLLSRIWFNPELRSTLFLVPGLIAYIAMITAVLSTALSVVREKERGTMEQIRMAPIGAAAFIVGKTIPYFLLALISSLLIVLTSMALFDMPMRGSWLLLFGATALFLGGALGFGLLISTIAESQEIAFQYALLSSFLPTMLLSGFIFPIANMPVILQAVTYAVPARYYIVTLRGVLLKGIGFEAIQWELGMLVLFASVVLTLSSIRFARQHG